MHWSDLLPKGYYVDQISLVDQDPVLFKGTIRENIAYGSRDGSPSNQEIEDAALAANAHRFIVSLPQGYETLWSRSSSLSGGQKQRVAIARAILRDAPCMILDEATSSLDRESEIAVQDALHRLMKGRTVLVIAHRLSTIRDADKIVFIREGRVIESGTYDELLAKGDSAFKAMVETQSQVIVDE